MNRNRESLIKRLVDRKMASSKGSDRGCVPCFGSGIGNKTFCVCMARKLAVGQWSDSSSLKK